jgi:hypothetical protein
MFVAGAIWNPQAEVRHSEHAMAYDPATDRWRVLPDPPIENDPLPNPAAPGFVGQIASVHGFVILQVQYARSRAPTSPAFAPRIITWDAANERWSTREEFRYPQGAGVIIRAVLDDGILVEIQPGILEYPKQLAYRYLPAEDKVIPSPTLDLQSVSGIGVWTGNHAIYVGQGYDPRPLALDPTVPVYRRLDVHGAGVGTIVWTGTRVIIWGGTIFEDRATGSRHTINTGVSFAAPERWALSQP